MEPKNNEGKTDKARSCAAAGYAPKYEDLLVAVRAQVEWLEAEDNNLGTFWERVELCNYVKWASSKALGLTDEEYSGVPRIVFNIGQEHNQSLE